ncbi:universal stress protein [Natronomonas gomsonensis]|uniref:universal stress protein n=1 Tax=Natronomonas gomsonensis TaxID=1046043 RepID=UPI0015B9539F|nr:universal stress protein [Natronomonas gomsonensis]
MRILVPYDGAEQARKALDHAVERYGDGEIVLLYVQDLVAAGYEASPGAALPGYWKEWYEEAQTEAEQLFEEAQARVDVDLETESVVGRPERAIVEYVDDNPVDAVVIGSHGRSGVSRILLGSVAETVVRRSPVPVTVVR